MGRLQQRVHPQMPPPPERPASAGSRSGHFPPDSGAPEERPPYAVHINQPDWPAQRVRQEYKTNYIRTTKYTILTFLPLNLFHQFSRFYNIYFLLSAVLSLIFPSASPINPFLTVFPLALVLLVTAIKDIFEDYLRYRSDRKANNVPCLVANHGDGFRTVRCQDIRPGDLVEVSRDEAFPADLVLLASTHVDHQALIQTAQLDGETNLKRRKAVYDHGLGTDDVARLTQARGGLQMTGVVECEAPNENMYKFEGRLLIDGEEPIVLRPNNVLLRGAVLRNTDKVLGVAIYVGEDTKIMRNLHQTRLKTSTLERRVNFIVVVVFVINVVVWFLSLLWSGEWQESVGRRSWYIDWDISGVDVVFQYHLVTYFVLWTYLIPLSLFVSIELVRVAQLLFMNWDASMVSRVEGKEVGMSCNNSNLNEDLGRVEHIFSDKTGTLTQNVMNLRSWHLDGHTLHEAQAPATPLSPERRARLPGILARTIRQISDGVAKTNVPSVDRLRLLLRAVALCNTVVPFMKEDADKGGAPTLVYEADSPDELALLEALRLNGVELRDRRQSGVTLAVATSNLVADAGRAPAAGADAAAVGWTEEEWNVLQVLEFSSDRKRMSVLVQRAGDANAPYYLITKGADSVMLPLMAKPPVNAPAEVKDIQAALDNFARKALRTLIIGYRELEAAEVETFLKEYQVADQAIGGRAEQVARVAATVEVNLRLLACTAVEDKLQVDCAETIRYLMDANIHFWLLTGDKRETAIAVGVQSGLLDDPTSVMLLEADTLGAAGQQVDLLLRRLQPDEKRVLVVDGATLYFLLDSMWSDAFLRLAESTRSVICCRVTPLQKAQVVQLVKSKLNRICLSIGDGANDVSMIEAANIGVGIVGKEGSQAVRASDYSFVEFRFLKRLVAVHGRYSYLRLRQLVLYSFYKNIAFIMVIFWWGWWSAWSGQSIYNDTILSMVNVLYLSLPPLAQGIFEKDISEAAIYREPRLYREVQGNIYFNRRALLAWIAPAVYECIILYFILFLAFDDTGVIDFRTMSLYYSTIALAVVLIKSLLTTRQITWVNWAAVGLSYGVYLATIFALGIAFPYTGSPVAMFTDAGFYFLFVLTVVVALTPDVAFAYWYRQERPFDWEILQEEDVAMRSAYAVEPGNGCELKRSNSSVQESERMPVKTSLRHSFSGYGTLE